MVNGLLSTCVILNHVVSGSKKGHAKRRGLRAFGKIPGTPLLLEFDPSPTSPVGPERKAQRCFVEYRAESFQSIQIKLVPLPGLD
jgi:hypothetical protein